jgi:hypothetical protein
MPPYARLVERSNGTAFSCPHIVFPVFVYKWFVQKVLREAPSAHQPRSSLRAELDPFGVRPTKPAPTGPWSAGSTESSAVAFSRELAAIVRHPHLTP